MSNIEAIADLIFPPLPGCERVQLMAQVIDESTMFGNIERVQSFLIAAQSNMYNNIKGK